MAISILLPQVAIGNPTPNVRSVVELNEPENTQMQIRVTESRKIPELAFWRGRKALCTKGVWQTSPLSWGSRRRGFELASFRGIKPRGDDATVFENSCCRSAKEQLIFGFQFTKRSAFLGVVIARRWKPLYLICRLFREK